MTYVHAKAFVDHCLAHSNWRMALCQAIQWDTSLRQKDVIGQWRTEPETYQLRLGEIRGGRKV